MEQAVEEVKETPKPKARKKDRSPQLIIQFEPETDGIHYEVLLPNEVIRLKPLMIMFFASIGYDKARNNPEPYLRRAINESSSRFTEIYCAYHNNIPIGYIWFRIEVGLYNDNLGIVEQLYVLDEFKNHISIIKRLMAKFLDFSKRLDTKQLILHAATGEHQKLWASYGFENSYLVMKFDGTVDEFIKHNGVERLFGGNLNGKHITAATEESG